MIFYKHDIHSRTHDNGIVVMDEMLEWNFFKM